MSPKVLFVAAEALPLAKTGGLGDVVSALASALHQRGADVTILLPAYPQAKARAKALREVASFTSLGGEPAKLLHGTMPDGRVSVLLLECDALFDRPGNPYLDVHGNEFADNAQRFAALAYAAAFVASGQSTFPAPDLTHAHDWHAGLTPLYLLQNGSKIPSALTIHNLAFQGRFALDLAETVGVRPEYRGQSGVEFWGSMSYLKTGVRFADRVTTVSASYAQEILTERFGCGMEGLLQERAAQNHLIAIPNGVDTQSWNPETDTTIAARYGFANMKGKIACKRSLQQALGLNDDGFAPIIALGSRLTTQKMADVALGALDRLLTQHPRLQVAVLGAGEANLEQGFRHLAERYPGRVGVFIGYDEGIAHQLHAGADMLLHGSRFEPFGLTPVYSMLYGTIPIASRVGGLIDTVTDAGDAEEPRADATGFLFDGDGVDDMTASIERALRAFAQPALWRVLQRNGMTANFAWGHSAELYIDMYAGMTSGAVRQSFLQLKTVPNPVSDDEPLSQMKRA